MKIEIGGLVGKTTFVMATEEPAAQLQGLAQALRRILEAAQSEAVGAAFDVTVNGRKLEGEPLAQLDELHRVIVESCTPEERMQDLLRTITHLARGQA